MSLKSTITTLAFTTVLLLSAASAQIQDDSAMRTVGLVHSKNNLAALVLHNTSDVAINTSVEVLDAIGQVITVITETSSFDVGETKSVAASVLPDGAAAIRVGDTSIEITFRYETGGGHFVEMRTLDSQIHEAVEFEETTGRFAGEESRDASVAPRMSTNVASSNISTCGGLSSPGNPFPCNNGGNCVWFGWKMASDRWGIDFPARGNAKTWVNSATANYFRVLPTAAVDTIAVNTNQRDITGQVTGHVGWTVSVSGNTVCTQEMSWGVWGMKTVCRDRSYWNGGFIYAPTISVVSPNTPSLWRINSNQWVTWAYTGTPGATVRIELVMPAVLQGNDSVWVLANSASVGSRGNGSALIRVPTVPLTGGAYYVRIVSTSLPRYWGASQFFLMK